MRLMRTRGRTLLTQHLQRCDFPKKAFAEASGVTAAGLCHLLAGKRRPSLQLAYHIERASDGEVPALSWMEEEPADERATSGSGKEAGAGARADQGG
jgi:transcriptional regulator with XRE-family HTH domain